MTWVRDNCLIATRPMLTVPVVKRFKAAWKVSNPACPPIKQIYKIIESSSFLKPYDVYKYAPHLPFDSSLTLHLGRRSE